ncbi:GNAT family N-acetyltransferase [bacterium]|nr:GNAT family N-acetyltransferase [bacterium]
MPPALHTARLHLRPVALQDGDFVVASLNDLGVSGWLSVVPYPYTQADFRFFVGELAKPGQTFAVEAGQGIAGILDLKNDTLGYWLAPAAQGRGYATEAARAVLAQHFAAGGGPVTSGHFEGNLPSANVLRKLGFVETGRDQRFCRALNQTRPHVALRLTPAEFAASS